MGEGREYWTKPRSRKGLAGLLSLGSVSRDKIAAPTTNKILRPRGNVVSKHEVSDLIDFTIFAEAVEGSTRMRGMLGCP